MAVNFNDLGASTTIQSETTRIFSSMSFSADGEPVYLVLNENYLINLLGSLSSEFNVPDIWKKITITYSPSSSPQIKSLTFRRSDSQFRCTTSWGTYAQTGTWNLYKLYIINKEGALLELNGSNFPSDSITIS